MFLVGRQDPGGTIPTIEPGNSPDGPPAAVRAAAAALRSRGHEMLFDAVAAQIGDAAWRETANGGATRRLSRRDPIDPSQIVPWPVLELSIGGRFGVVTDWMPVGDVPLAATDPPPQPPPPKLRGLGPGEVRLVDGDEHVEIVYGDDGAMLGTCRSHHPRPLAGLAPALAAEGANPIELLARFIGALDPSRHGPGRVFMPAAMPHGVEGVWRCGLGALRRAPFRDGVPRGANWAVAAGLTGTVLGFAAAREQALRRWRAAVAARSPWLEPKTVPEPPFEVPRARW